MPRFLLLNSESDFPQDWRLPEGVDIKALEQALRRSMRSGEVLEVRVATGPQADVEATLFLNVSKLTSAAVIEAEKRPTLLS